MRRMLTVQDRAAIAKGLQEGCSLRRTADRIVWIGVRGISGDTPQRREVWVSAGDSWCESPETPVQAKDPQDRCRIGSSRLGCWRI